MLRSMADQKRPEPPLAYLVIGTFVSVIGGVLLVLDDDMIRLVGSVVLIVGTSLAFVAAVAAGVEWGMRRARS